MQRTALFNYLYARHHGGTFIRRRYWPQAIEMGARSQLENLRWLPDWDESPETHENYRQSERLEFVSEISIDQLLGWRQGLQIYARRRAGCWARCQEAAGETPAKHHEYLHERGESATSQSVKQQVSFQRFVWLSMNLVSTSDFRTFVKGDIEFEGGNIGGDWVIQKKDGYPTYNFAALSSMITICKSLTLSVVTTMVA